MICTFAQAKFLFSLRLARCISEVPVAVVVVVVDVVVVVVVVVVEVAGYTREAYCTGGPSFF
jgi:hypothetical protein